MTGLLFQQYRLGFVLVPVFVFTVAFFSHCAAAQRSKKTDQTQRPHIVFILADDMGYGDLQSFNERSRISTPHLDQLARQGMRFTDAHAPGPLCHMSRYGLMTGRYPFRVNVGVWPRNPLIQKGEVTLPGMLQAQGYRTAMIGKWHLGFDESRQDYSQPMPGGPVDHGFDSFFGIRASTDIPPYFYIRDDQAVIPPTQEIAANQTEGWSPIQGEFWRAGKIAPDMKLSEVLPTFTREAVKTIRDAASESSQPLFLYLAYPSPHTPWLPRDTFRGKSAVGLYGDFMMDVDDQIGQVLAALSETGMAEETLLVFTSDNGPCWYEEDAIGWQHDSAGPFRGMKSDVWEAGHRMPMIIRWPNRIAADSVSDQLVCFTDFMATFAELLGESLPTSASPDSESFLSCLLPDRESSDERRTELVIRAGSVKGMHMIRSGDWKLINRLGSGGFTRPNQITPTPAGPPGQLYNLKDDPGETTNLYLQYPEIVVRLQERRDQIVGPNGFK